MNTQRVNHIKKLLSKGLSQRKVADKLGVCQNTISLVSRGFYDTGKLDKKKDKNVFDFDNRCPITGVIISSYYR